MSLEESVSTDKEKYQTLTQPPATNKSGSYARDIGISMGKIVDGLIWAANHVVIPTRYSIKNVIELNLNLCEPYKIEAFKGLLDQYIKQIKRNDIESVWKKYSEKEKRFREWTSLLVENDKGLFLDAAYLFSQNLCGHTLEIIADILMDITDKSFKDLPRYIKYFKEERLAYNQSYGLDLSLDFLLKKMSKLDISRIPEVFDLLKSYQKTLMNLPSLANFLESSIRKADQNDNASKSEALSNVMNALKQARRMCDLPLKKKYSNAATNILINMVSYTVDVAKEKPDNVEEVITKFEKEFHSFVLLKSDVWYRGNEFLSKLKEIKNEILKD